MALPAGRKGVLPSELTPEGKIRNSASPYVLPTASADTLGGVKVGSGLSIDNGVLSANGYTLPVASAETLGGVKIGSGLSIDDGVLSAAGGASIGVYEKNITGVTITAGGFVIGDSFAAPNDLIGKTIIGASVVASDKYICCIGIARASDPVVSGDWLYPVYVSPREYSSASFKLNIFYK